MLLSFERPAALSWRPAGCWFEWVFSADLENCTVANMYGYHRARRVLTRGVFGAPPGRLSFVRFPSGNRVGVGEMVPFEITVKMLRAHGGCLGTRSR